MRRLSKVESCHGFRPDIGEYRRGDILKNGQEEVFHDWQIPVAEKDIPKTAFVTPNGTYEFIKMPFGMVNSGATLARGMRNLIGDLDDVDNDVDDIIVHTERWEGHLTALDELLQRLSDTKLTAKTKDEEAD